MVEQPNRGQNGWQRPFFAIWGGQAFSLLGSQLVQFALVWWLTRETGSATVLALATLVALLPQIFLSPLAGVLVDRWDRRRVMIGADVIIALATAGLLALFALDRVAVWQLYVVMLIRSAGGAFHWPAMQASITLMAPETQLARVAGFNSMLSGALNIVAPPLGALLLELLPVAGVLGIDLLTAGMAIVPLLFVPVPAPARARHALGGDAFARGYVRQLWGELGEGVRYVRTWPGLAILLGMSALINFLLVPAGSLLPLLVKSEFSGDALDFGGLQSMIGIGMVAGGLLLSVWGGFRRRIVTVLAGLMGVGLTHIALGIVPEALFPLALVAVLGAGISAVLANGPLLAVIQATTAPEVQGRVLTLMNSLSVAMSPLSLALAGPLSDVLGVRFWYVLAGGISLLMGIGGFAIPALVDIEAQGLAQREGVRAGPLA